MRRLKVTAPMNISRRKWGRYSKEAEAADAKEDSDYGQKHRGNELPEELRNRNSRLRRLMECKQRLEEEAAAHERKQRGKIEERNLEEAEMGHKKRGRKPKEPQSEPPLKQRQTSPIRIAGS